MTFLAFAAAVLAIVAMSQPREGLAFRLTLWVLLACVLGVLGGLIG